MGIQRVGAFSWDGETKTLTGPARYLAEQGDALIQSINAGEDLVFNLTCLQSPDMVTAVLVRLQTDYAGWLGRQRTLAELGLDGRRGNEKR